MGQVFALVLSAAAVGHRRGLQPLARAFKAVSSSLGGISGPFAAPSVAYTT